MEPSLPLPPIAPPTPAAAFAAATAAPPGSDAAALHDAGFLRLAATAARRPLLVITAAALPVAPTAPVWTAAVDAVTAALTALVRVAPPVSVAGAVTGEAGGEGDGEGEGGVGVLLIASRPDGGRVLPPVRVLASALWSVPPEVRAGIAEVGCLHPGVGLRALLWGVWPWFGGRVWRRMVVADRMDELWTDGLVRPDDLALPPEAFSYERSVADATAAAAGLLVASGAAPPSALPRTTAPPPPPVAAATTATPGMEGG
ncbi:hypothetical protein I4F81_006808 [Pyropia yezoensis]|uniref:Uncharacterized protein n=1 Tax=Pyropia yezoensis TaxID=2788 RepID=A0ACC3C1R1_PYRYE|nr:hypothetical protein I4F81_006808 [Neopyropia yezoensis]